MTRTAAPKVETYTLTAGNGRPIRQATQVIYADGTVVRFTEKMPKRDAIRQAEWQRSR